MRVLAKFLLPSVFVFLPAIGCAQDDYFVPQKDCGSLRAFGNTTIVEEMADKQACIIGNQIQLKASVENLRFRVSGNEIDIKVLEDKLRRTQLETKIELLEANQHSLERRLSMAEDEIEWLTRKTPASKLRAPVSKPAPDFIPAPANAMQSTASNKSGASKPKTTANKPTIECDAQGRPLQPSNKPKASAPKAATGPPDGTH